MIVAGIWVKINKEKTIAKNTTSIHRRRLTNSRSVKKAVGYQRSRGELSI